MKTLKLLNKKNLSITIFSLLLTVTSFAEEKPVDIWNIDKKEVQSSIDDNGSEENEKITEARENHPDRVKLWLEECGQQLNLPHTEREAEKIAKSKQRWNDDVLAEIASEEAREILEWKERQSRN